MTRPERGDAAEYAAHRRARGRAQTDITDGLFATEQAVGARDAAIDKSARKALIQRDIERLRPHVLELARHLGAARLQGGANTQEEGETIGGITAADVRRLGEQRGIFSGHETGRQLSWLGPAMKTFGLVATRFVRRSEHRTNRSHGNRHTVYVHPDYAKQGSP